MNQDTHNIGDVHLEQDHGMIWLARSNYVGYDKIVCDNLSLAKSTISPNTKVYYKNKPIGTLNSVQYNNKDGFLVGFFSLGVNRDCLPDSDCLFSSINYEPNGIQCIRCQSIFKVGSESCECIESAPAIKIPIINILSVSIYNGMNDNINTLDSRLGLLRKYFGGIIASIELDEGF